MQGSQKKIVGEDAEENQSYRSQYAIRLFLFIIYMAYW